MEADTRTTTPASRMCDYARQFATVKRIMTARVAEVMREHLNYIGATTITDGEMNAIISMWLEVATEDAPDAELFNRLVNVFDECAEAAKKQSEENIKLATELTAKEWVDN